MMTDIFRASESWLTGYIDVEAGYAFSCCRREDTAAPKLFSATMRCFPHLQYLGRFSGENPREMTREEIKTVISNAARAAERVKEAGCDAVEIVANSGYMISQFLSPFTNKRTDEYGGSFEKRCRFGIEMIEAIREAVGKDFPVILRVAGNEFIRDGNGMEECAAFCKKAEAAGIDAVNVTGGWHETKIPQLPADVPRGAFTYLAQNVKKAVSVPVISSNRHNTPEEAEKVIATGQADIVGEMRTLIADPDWVNKVIENRTHEIRKCLACNQGCFAMFSATKPVSAFSTATSEETAKSPLKKLKIQRGYWWWAQVLPDANSLTERHQEDIRSPYGKKPQC